jgi:hypothetical protein
MLRVIAIFALTLAACFTEEVDTAGLPTIDGYADWARHDFHGPLPGHGESWRSVFVNEVGQSFGGGGRYPRGTVLVKEVRDLKDGPAPGSLRYLAIMRKLGDDVGEPTNGGWLFTSADRVGGPELQQDLCWNTCHQQAPLDGAFADYGR